MTKPAVAAALITGLAMTTAAIAAPASATKAHHAHHQARAASSSDLAACLKRQSFCIPMSRHGGGHVWI